MKDNNQNMEREVSPAPSMPSYIDVLRILREIDTEDQANDCAELLHRLFPAYNPQASGWDIWRKECDRVWVQLTRLVREAGGPIDVNTG